MPGTRKAVRTDGSSSPSPSRGWERAARNVCAAEFKIVEVGRWIMDRRQVLGMVGAMALAAVMGVGSGRAAEKSKVVKAATASCCCDACGNCDSACCDTCGGCAICCGDACCCDSSTGNRAADKTVKAAKSKSCCLVTAAKTNKPKVTVAH